MQWSDKNRDGQMIHEKTISFICRALSHALRPSSSRSQENSGKSRGLPASCLGAHETTGRVRGADAGSHHHLGAETPAHDQLKANQTGTVPGPTLSPGPCQHPHSRPLVFHVLTARCPFPRTEDGCPARAQGLPPARGLVVGRWDKKPDGFSWHQIPGMEARTSER